MKRLGLYVVMVLAIACGLGATPDARAQASCDDITGTWTYPVSGHLDQTWTLAQDNTQNPPVVTGSITHVWVASLSEYATFTLGIGGQPVSKYTGQGTWSIYGANVTINQTYGGTVQIPLGQVGCAWFSFLSSGAYIGTCALPSGETETSWQQFTYNGAAGQFNAKMTVPGGFSFNGRTIQTNGARPNGGTCRNFVPFNLIGGIGYSSVGASPSYFSPPVGFMGDTLRAETFVGDARTFAPNQSCTVTYQETVNMDCPADHTQYPATTWTAFGTAITDTIDIRGTSVAYKRGSLEGPTDHSYGYTVPEMDSLSFPTQVLIEFCEITTFIC